MTDSVQQNMLSLYISGIIPSGLTFVFWILVANSLGPETIGIVIAVTSFAFILNTIAGFDFAIGMRRFLGQAYAEKNWLRFKQIFSISFTFTTLTSTGIFLIAINPFVDFLSMIGIERQFIVIIGFIILGNTVINTTAGALTSALKSQRIVLPTIISSFLRFPILLIPVYFVGFSELLVAYAYSVYFPILGIFTILIVWKLLRIVKGQIFENVFEKIKELFIGSFPSWLPNVATVLGTQLGILTIFSIKGGEEAGLFYITFAIFSVVILVPGAINTVSHPFLSGLKELNQQSDFLRKTMKINFLVTIPLAAVILFYSDSILFLIGEQFVVAVETLVILVLSVPLVIVSEGIRYLIYARGSYKKTLYLGFSSNIIRIILYFVLVPENGANGAAIAFVAGYIVHVILAITFAEQISVRLQYAKYIVISVIPLGIGILLEILGFPVWGVIILLITTIIVYLKSKLLNESDIESFLKLIMEPEKAKIKKNVLVKKLRKMYLM